LDQGQVSASQPEVSDQREIGVEEGESEPLVGATGRGGEDEGLRSSRETEGETGEHGLGYDEEEWGLPDAIKVGTVILLSFVRIARLFAWEKGFQLAAGGGMGGVG
jgi:hypothetical protein